MGPRNSSLSGSFAAPRGPPDERLGTDMTLSFTGRKRVRKSFGRIPSVSSMPNLIEVQKSSYDSFLMMGDDAATRPDAGLQSVFKSVFRSEARRVGKGCVRPCRSRGS